MLPLDDPLWGKLRTCYGDVDVAAKLSALYKHWNKVTADTLFYEALHHQESIYSATFAAVPHLLKIAEDSEDSICRAEIASFCGHVARCANPTGEQIERMRGRFDGLGFGEFEDQNDREAIEDAYMSCLPRIVELSSIELVNTSVNANKDGDPGLYLFYGIAAALGYIRLSFFIEQAADGQDEFQCQACRSWIEIWFFDDQVAVYTAPIGFITRTFGPGFADYKDGGPTRAEGFLEPIQKGALISSYPHLATLLKLAEDADRSDLAYILRVFAGRTTCPHCGSQTSPINSGW